MERVFVLGGSIIGIAIMPLILNLIAGLYNAAVYKPNIVLSKTGLIDIGPGRWKSGLSHWQVCNSCLIVISITLIVTVIVGLIYDAINKRK